MTNQFNLTAWSFKLHARYCLNHQKIQQAGTGPSRRHIKDSKIAKGFQSVKLLVNWGPFKKIERSLTMPKKLKGDTLVLSGILCYAGNLFGSVPWANRYNLVAS